MDVINISIWFMFALMVIFMIRVIKGPSAWDRLLGMNLVATKIIIITILFAYTFDVGFLLDFAIIYALFGFIAEIFIALFLAERTKEGKEE